MAYGSHLTLKDYLRQVPLAPYRQAEKPSDSPRFSPLDRFDNILSSCRKGNATPKNNAERGLTILDYMANPVRALLSSSSASARNGTGAVPVRGEIPSENERVSSQGKRSEKKEKHLGPGVLPTAGASVETTVLTAATKNRSLRQKIDRCIEKAAAKYRLPANLVRGVIQAESGFNVGAVSPAGACGLMQLMPETARELGVNQIFDIEENIGGGAKYLRQMLDRFNGNVQQALMAYNAGPGTVQRYQGDVPYKETRQYVERVLRFSGMTDRNQTIA